MDENKSRKEEGKMVNDYSFKIINLHLSYKLKQLNQSGNLTFLKLHLLRNRITQTFSCRK